MAIQTLAIVGDSIPQGRAGGFSIEQGGQGCWAELFIAGLTDLPQFGPLISSGFRNFQGGGTATSGLVEWTTAGSWTTAATSSTFNIAPYGHAQYGNGASAVATFTVPPLWRRIPVGYKITFCDKGSGGNWRYSLHGGPWTNHGQSLLNNDTALCFYVAAPPTTKPFRPGSLVGGPDRISARQTVDIQCSSDGTTGVDCMPLGVETFFVDPTTATRGTILHNYGYGGELLHNALVVSGGDKLATLDAVRLGTGSPLSSTPTAGVIVNHINDVALNNTTTWATDLTTIISRVKAYAPVTVLSTYETVNSFLNTTNQAAYRAQTKTTAAGLGVSVFDMQDVWTANGWPTNAAITAAGLVDTDQVHPSQAGHLDLAPRIVAWIRSLFFVSDRISWTDGYRTFKVAGSLVGGTDLVGGTQELNFRSGPRPRPPGRRSPGGVGFAPRVTHSGDQQQPTPTGIGSTVVFGVPTLTIITFLATTGIGSTVVFGDSHAYNVPYPAVFVARPRPPGKVSPGGVGFAPMRHTAHDLSFITTTGIGPHELLGIPAGSTVTILQPIATTGIASTVVLGAPSVSSGNRIGPTGIGPNERIGRPFGSSVVGVLTATPSGIASSVLFGVPVLSATSASQLLPTGIAAGEKVGKPAGSSVVASVPPQATVQRVRPPGRVSPGGLGFIRRTQPTVRTTQTISPVGIPPNGVYTTPAGDPYTTEAADAYYTVEQFPTIGVPTLTLQLKVHPSGVASTAMLGVPAVGSTYRLRPSGIVSTSVFGVPSLHGGQTVIRPVGIGSTVRFGVISGQAPHPTPVGIGSTVAFGVPRLSIAAEWNVREVRPRWTVGYPRGRWETRDPATAS